jgi:hypothetical protein
MIEHPGPRIEDGLTTPTDVLHEQSSDADCWHQRLDKQLQSIAAGIARLERKLDRILALSVESRRNR